MKERMSEGHILLLAEEFYPSTSGGAHARWKFAKQAVERGYSVTAFTSRETDTPRFDRVEGVEIHRPPLSIDPVVYSTVGLLTRVIGSIMLLLMVIRWAISERENFNVVLSTSHLTHWIGWAVSGLLRRPLVSMVGYTPSVVPNPDPSAKLYLERLNFRMFMGEVVFCRNGYSADALGGQAIGEIRLLPGILDSDVLSGVATRERVALREKYDFGADEFVLAFVGRLVPIKRPTAALDIIERLPMESTLVIVGDGSARETVESHIDDRSLDDRVRMLGELPHEAALEVIAAADALIITSRAESYCATGLEGLVLDTLVFATPVGVLPEVESDRLVISEVDEMATTIAEWHAKRWYSNESGGAAIDADSGGIPGTTSDSAQPLLNESLLREHSATRLTDALLAGIDDVTRDGE